MVPVIGPANAFGTARIATAATAVAANTAYFEKLFMMEELPWQRTEAGRLTPMYIVSMSMRFKGQTDPIEMKNLQPVDHALCKKLHIPTERKFHHEGFLRTSV